MSQQQKSERGRPKEYRGPLTPSQIADGMNAARRNAQRLAADAKILLDAGRLPTAAAVAALSIEESGKIPLLRGLATATAPEEIKSAWRAYRDHRSKNGAWILRDLVKAGAKKLSDFASVVERDGEHTSLLNLLKQLGLYTDCYGDAHWSEPSKVFEGDNADLPSFLVTMAEILSKGKETSAREIELWIEHLKPVWNTSEMSNALIRFADAMHRERLSNTSPEKYAKFVFGELGDTEWNTQNTDEH